MPSYLHPGVYVEEIPSGSKPIEGVATSVAAFVGTTQRGPAANVLGTANLIQKLDDYKREYGDISGEDDAMGFAVQAFYLNGGKSAYICRLVGEDSEAASAGVNGEGGNPALILSASSEGAWGNDLFFRILKPDPGALTFTVEAGFREDGEFQVEEAFRNLSMREADGNYAVAQINSGSSLLRAAVDDAIGYSDATVTGAVLPAAATHFSAAAWPLSLTLNLNGMGTEQVTLDAAAFAVPLTGALDADAASVAAEVQAAVRALGPDAAHQSFGCAYAAAQDRFILTAPEDGSAARLDIPASPLATRMGIGPESRTRMTGGDIANPAPAGDFDDFFSTTLGGLAQPMTLVIEIDNKGAQALSFNAADIGISGDHQTEGDIVARAIQNAVRAVDLTIPAYRDFACAYAGNRMILTSGSNQSPQPGLTVTGTMAAPLKLDGANATVAEGRAVIQGTTDGVPVETLGLLGQGARLAGGAFHPPTAAEYADFYGTVLRKVRDANILLVPGQSWAADGSGNAILSQTLAHAEAMRNRMVLIDPPPGLELDQAATVDTMGLPTSTYSTLYYPWVRVANPFYNAETNPTAARNITIAPSAFAAGMWSKIDGKRGVWKAPAGVETQLLGAAGLEFEVEDGEQDQLNPMGVNCVRKLPGYGRVIWGSRTLSTQADPEWRYVPVRRTAIFIEQSIYNGIQWAVFEPNDFPLWGALRSNIGAFMNGLFRAGAFQGGTAKDAYFVRCGLGDTMTQADIDRGQVIVIVGFAPLKPAEFVIVRIQQKVDQQ